MGKFYTWEKSLNDTNGNKTVPGKSRSGKFEIV